MVLLHQRVVGLLDLGIARRARDAEDHIGILTVGTEMRGADPLELRAREAEDVGHVLEEFEFPRMQVVISLGNHEETVQQVFKDRRLAAEQRGKLPRIGIEAGDIRLGQVEQLPDIGLFLVRDGKHALEGIDLIARHRPVGLGQLGGKGDHADREGNLVTLAAIVCVNPARLGPVIADRLALALRLATAAVHHHVAGDGPKQRPQRPAHEDQARRGPGNLAPDRHICSVLT